MMYQGVNVEGLEAYDLVYKSCINLTRILSMETSNRYKINEASRLICTGSQAIIIQVSQCFV